MPYCLPADAPLAALLWPEMPLGFMECGTYAGHGQANRQTWPHNALQRKYGPTSQEIAPQGRMTMPRRCSDPPGLSFVPAEGPEEDLRNALAVLFCFRGRALPQPDAEAVERRVQLALSKLKGRA